MSKTDFVNSIKEGALKGKVDYGILPSLILAQAILESGWGTSELSQKANNLFGIKAFSDWKGKRITFSTTEWYNNQRTVVEADFRAYDSLDDSIEDHNKLLSFTRYKPLIGETDYKRACEKVFQCGYATDPSYAEKLIRIIEENRLYDIDVTGYQNKASKYDKILKFQKLCNKINIKDYENKQLTEDNILGPRTKSCIPKMPTLMLGSQGAAVEFVQVIVNAMPVDGDFGPITKQCVMTYQKNHRIVIDGIVGIETWTTIVTT